MAMGEHDPGKPLLLILDELEVGQDQLNAGLAGVGKGQAKVDHDPLAAAAVEIDVHADLARPAERDEEELLARNHWDSIIGLREVAMSYSRLNPWMVRSGSIASKTWVCLSNKVARPPVATTVIGPPTSCLIRSARPSSMAT